ncbi:MAG: hypothetical protein WBB95_00225, partial [Pseudomonas sp.]|uniref:hypothetical protein n=1 Tax=Pseudomonas sp. TaxID=306 RepID=UPI003C73F5F4
FFCSIFQKKPPVAEYIEKIALCANGRTCTQFPANRLAKKPILILNYALEFIFLVWNINRARPRGRKAV